MHIIVIEYIEGEHVNFYRDQSITILRSITILCKYQLKK